LLASGAALLMLIAGFIVLVVGLFQIVGNIASVPGDFPLYPLGLILLTIGALLIPFAILKFKSLGLATGEPIVKSPAQRISSPVVVPIVLSFWATVVLVGYFIAGQGLVSTLVMPFLTIPGVILPVFFYIYSSFNKTESLPRSRGWGVLSSGITLAPFFAIVLEFGILVITMIFIVIVIMQDSSLMSELQIAATRLSSGQGNPEVINNMLVAFIRRPLNQFLLLSIVSGLIPIIEEVVKQIPLWLLSWRRLTPRVGFIIGGLGGAGFALFEGLLAASSLGGPDQWLYLIFGRAGASLMHVLTGAIGGWGLASAIQGRSYLKAVLAYVTCIIIHGAWNALAIWEGISRLVGSSTYSTLHLSRDSLPPTILMGVYFLVMLTLLIKNKKMIKD
jgi:PrsW family intramembrane metalloprotease